MQKLLFRSLMLSLIFLSSLIFFVFRMKENSLTREIETTEMSGAGLSVISALCGEDEINFMYGYTRDIFSLGVREEITPVRVDGGLDFILYHYGNEVVSVLYEINNRVERIVLETGEARMLALDQTGEKSRISLKSSYNFSPEAEYGLKLILVNKDGRKTYYYTTLKYQKNDELKSNFSFVKRLEKAIFEKRDEDFVKKYLESNNTMENMSFEHVNIHSSYDLVSWGSLSPTKVTSPRISLLENNSSSSAFLYKYIVSVGSEHKNYYSVSEFYRVNTMEHKVFLRVYDRRLEEIFMPEKTSVAKKQLKFGIGDKNTDFLVSESKEFIGFIRERELWQYETKTNTLNRIFSFGKGDFTLERENLDRHKLRLLRQENNGDIFFLVYGYMNRGVYEGRNGMVVYKYHGAEKRIEELVYLPIDKLYNELIHDVDRMNYLSADGFFYFFMEGKLCSYSLAKKRVEIISKKAEEDLFLVLDEGERVAWQEEGKTDEIFLLDMETRQRTRLRAEQGSRFVLFTAIDGNMVYGKVLKKDIRKNRDGSVMLPCEKIIISDSFGTILKEYSKKDYYVVDVVIEGSVIHLKRIVKKEGVFLQAEEDQILNNHIKKPKEVSIVDRRTEKYLTEYYLKLPKEASLTTLPETFTEVLNTVILSETTAKLPEEEESVFRYYAVVGGRVVSSSKKPYQMIRIANESMGYVIDSGGTVVWERGKMKASYKAEEVDVDYMDQADTEKEAAIRIFLTANGIYIPDSELRTGKSIMDILNTQTEIRALDLSGISLDEALYYVSEGNPVIAMADERLVLIVAYQAKNISIMNVKTGEVEVLPKEEAETLFLKAGNHFISAIG